MDQELYELCLSINNEEVIDANFWKKCEPIEAWIDKTIESIKKELTEKYNNEPQYKSLDIGKKGYLYFEEQINLFFKAMHAEEHKEIYIHKNSYNAICASLSKAINIEYKLTKKIKEPNSILKLNLFKIYSSWYVANKSINTLVLTEKKFSNILKKHDVTLEQITNINWIIENRNNAETVFSDIHKREKKRIKELEKSNLNAQEQPQEIYASDFRRKNLENFMLPLDKTQQIYNQLLEKDTYMKYLTGDINDKDKKLYAKVLITLSDDIDKYTDKYLTNYDRDVFNAVNSFILQGDEKLTSNQIWKIYNKSRMNSRQQAQFIKSINKLRTGLIYIEVSTEMKKSYKNHNLKSVYSGPLLPVDVIFNELENGKIEITIGQLKSDNYIYSPWLDYVLAIKQYTTLNPSVLKTPTKIPYSETSASIKYYLLERVERGNDKKENDKNRNTWKDRTITFKSIYEKTKKTSQYINRKDNLKRDQEKVIKIAQRYLENWCNIDHLFKSYEIDYNAQKIFIKYK